MQSLTRTEHACILAALAGCDRESEPTFTLDQQIAQARAEMGEARWAELGKEWSKP